MRNAFVVMMGVAGSSAAATALVALGWWNVRGEQAPATALGIALVLMASAVGSALLGCRLYPKSEAASRTNVTTTPAVAPAVTMVGPGS